MDEKVTTLSIGSDQKLVGSVGQAVREISESLSFVSASPGGIELACVESVNNCIEHAYGFDIDNVVDIRCVISRKDMSLHITDNGKPMPLETRDIFNGKTAIMPEHDVDVVMLPEGGWGVPLVKSLCDSTSYTRDDESNTLTLVFDLAC